MYLMPCSKCIFPNHFSFTILQQITVCTEKRKLHKLATKLALHFVECQLAFKQMRSNGANCKATGIECDVIFNTQHFYPQDNFKAGCYKNLGLLV